MYNVFDEATCPACHEKISVEDSYYYEKSMGESQVQKEGTCPVCGRHFKYIVRLAISSRSIEWVN